MFELGTQSLRAAYFTTDVDIFQALERDASVKRRFEEGSAGELQMGWDRGRDGGKTVEVVREREREVTDLLRKRGDGGERGDGEGKVEDGGDVDRVLSRGFGDVRPG